MGLLAQRTKFKSGMIIICTAKPVNFSEAMSCPVHPYTFGSWMDSSTKSPMLRILISDRFFLSVEFVVIHDDRRLPLYHNMALQWLVHSASSHIICWHRAAYWTVDMHRDVQITPWRNVLPLARRKFYRVVHFMMIPWRAIKSPPGVVAIMS